MGHGRDHHTADSLRSHDKIPSRQNETVHERKQGVVNSVRLEEGTPKGGIHNQNPAEGAAHALFGHTRGVRFISPSKFTIFLYLATAYWQFRTLCI